MAATELVLLHGFMGRGDDWQPLLPDLRASARTPDLPWHGSLAGSRPPGWQAMLAVVARELPARSHLVGYSFGARVALGIAALWPERVVGLTLIAGNPGIADAAGRLARQAADEDLAQRLERDGMDAFLSSWYELPLFAGVAARPELRRELTGRRRDNDPVALAGCLRVAGTGRMPDYRSFLAESAIPLHYLAGQRDRKYCAIAGELQRLRPDARATIVSECSHALVQEAPAAVAEFTNSAHAHVCEN